MNIFRCDSINIKQAHVAACVGICIALLIGCRARPFNQWGRESRSKGSSLSENGRPEYFIYTFTGPGSDPADYQAYSRNNFKRFAFRMTGSFMLSPESTSTLEWVSDLDEKSKLKLDCTQPLSGPPECRIVATFPRGIGDGISFECKANDVDFAAKKEQTVVPCTNGANLHLVLPSSLGVVKPPRALKSFEFMRTGNPLKASQARVPVISSNGPLKFRVPKNLSKNSVFVKNLKFAFEYWNSAAGRNLLSTELIESDDKFDFKQSGVFSADLEKGTLGRAGFFADGITGGIMAIHVRLNATMFEDDKLAPSVNVNDFLSTLIHELGHGLALAHNFAGSADPLGTASGGTTFMDYFKRSTPVSSTPLPYDLAAMRYLYQGEEPTKTFLHCTDLQSAYLPYCGEFDLAPMQVSELFQLFSSMDVDTLAQKLAGASFLAQEEHFDGANAGDPGAHLTLLDNTMFGDSNGGTSFRMAYKQIWFGIGQDPKKVAELKEKWLEGITAVRLKTASNTSLAGYPKLIRLLAWMESLMKKPFLLAGPTDGVEI